MHTTDTPIFWSVVRDLGFRPPAVLPAEVDESKPTIKVSAKRLPRKRNGNKAVTK